MRLRGKWLARPWFFAAVATLAINDHVLKAAWPGLVTGKVSDFAGVVVVATLAAVVVGRTGGVVLAALGFTALKTVPGVAELVAPALGGGVTLRDPTDLVALAALPVLWSALGRVADPGADEPAPDPPRERRRRPGRPLEALGLVLALLATTATSPPRDPESQVREVGYIGGTLYAQVFSAEHDDSLWMRSDDDGATWRLEPESPGWFPATKVVTTRIDEPGTVREEIEERCTPDEECWRMRAYLEPGTEHFRRVIERPEGAGWVEEVELPWHPSRFFLDVDDGSRLGVASWTAIFVRTATGEWREINLLAELAELPAPAPSPST